MSTSQWYVAEGGRTLGPFSTADVRQSLHSGRWTAGTLVCPLGENSWQPVSGVPELRTGIGDGAPPPRPPAPGRMHEVDYRIFRRGDAVRGSRARSR